MIDQQLASLRQSADADDVILFYYSGHGDFGTRVDVDDDECLDLPNGDDYTEAELQAQLQLFAASTQKIVILDSCYSGGFLGLSRTCSNTTATPRT